MALGIVLAVRELLGVLGAGVIDNHRVRQPAGAVLVHGPRRVAQRRVLEHDAGVDVALGGVLERGDVRRAEERRAVRGKHARIVRDDKAGEPARGVGLLEAVVVVHDDELARARPEQPRVELLEPREAARARARGEGGVGHVDFQRLAAIDVALVVDLEEEAVVARRHEDLGARADVGRGDGDHRALGHGVKLIMLFDSNAVVSWCLSRANAAGMVTIGRSVTVSNLSC